MLHVFSLIIDHDDCTNIGLKCLRNKRMPGNHGYSSSNTLLINDEPYRALLNPPNTAIFTTKYTVCDMTDNLLVMINRFHDHRLFLDGLVEAADVLSYVKNNPFG
ncbi:hypothetical protein DCAR_0519832 [Daucus carota subsp. sativus]|uniref:FCP1 homology domain-containing protein n=1 Tax=Daucus carota subsp. sativus TaxID=79200 RepID=A0AAF1AYW7_DAUCS|nr:hypothetical protein DCAR_0519832 [Daucus carota subsp. sativus]